MTAKELLASEMEDAGYQLNKAIEGLPDDKWSYKSCASAMTPAEIIEHLCEAYQALVTHTAGGKHEWGSFKIEDKSPENLRNTFTAMRSRAVGSVLNGEDDDALTSGHLYIVAHDYYHVGQLALSRLEATPDWDPFSIYNF